MGGKTRWQPRNLENLESGDSLYCPDLVDATFLSLLSLSGFAAALVTGPAASPPIPRVHRLWTLRMAWEHWFFGPVP